MSERDIIAQSEFGMDYDQLGANEQEWVRDEIGCIYELRKQLLVTIIRQITGTIQQQIQKTVMHL